MVTPAAELEKYLLDLAPGMSKEQLAELIGSSPETYRSLVQLSFSGKKPVDWRAAWIADYLAEIRSPLAEPHLDTILQQMKLTLPGGVLRCYLRLLSRYPIPEAHQGVITDLCFESLSRESIPVAVKVHAMEILTRFSETYPELKNELVLILREQMVNNSTGFKSRARKIIGRLEKEKTED